MGTLSDPGTEVVITTMKQILDLDKVKIKIPKPRKYTSKYLRWCKWMISYGVGPEQVYIAIRKLGRRRIRVLYKKIRYPMGLRPPFNQYRRIPWPNNSKM